MKVKDICDLLNKTNSKVNLTPHPIRLCGDDGLAREWPASSTPLRLEEKREEKGFFTKVTYSLPKDAPSPQSGVDYIVSLPVLMVMKDRKDFIAPDTGAGAVRDEDGKIIGTKGFITINQKGGLE
jgi:hypothetical protein